MLDWKEGSLSEPAVWTPADAALDTIGCFCCKGTSLGHVQLFAYQDPQVLFWRASSQEVVSACPSWCMELSHLRCETLHFLSFPIKLCRLSVQDPLSRSSAYHQVGNCPLNCCHPQACWECTVSHHTPEWIKTVPSIGLHTDPWETSALPSCQQVFLTLMILWAWHTSQFSACLSVQLSSLLLTNLIRWLQDTVSKLLLQSTTLHLLTSPCPQSQSPHLSSDGQLQFALCKSRMAAPNPLLPSICLEMVSKQICSITFPRTEMRLTLCAYWGFPFCPLLCPVFQWLETDQQLALIAMNFPRWQRAVSGWHQTTSFSTLRCISHDPMNLCMSK